MEHWFQFTQISTASLPDVVEFVMTQHVQHGPVIFHAKNPFFINIGIAGIKTHLDIAPQFAALFGVKVTSLELGNDLISFRGGYFMHWQLGHAQLSTLNNAKIALDQITTSIWIYPEEHHISGGLTAFNVRISDEDGVLTIPAMNLEFDHRRDDNGLWLGNYNIHFPSMKLYNIDDDNTLMMSDIYFDSRETTHSALLSGERKLDIRQVSVDDQVVGPLHLSVSLHNINIKAITGMIHVYESTIQTGELYQGQLQRKIFAKFPELINSDSKLQLDAFTLATPQGMIHMNGEIQWPAANLMQVDNITDLAQAAHGKLELQIPKVLMNQLISLMSKISYFRKPISAIERGKLLQAQDQLNFSIDASRYIFSQFIENYLVPEQAGIQLYKMQQNFEPTDEYANQLKELLFQGQISLPVSYLLYWEYLKTQQPYELLINTTTAFDKAAEQDLHHQLIQLLHQGYITEMNSQDYLVSLRWSDGELETKPQLKK